MLPLIFGQSPLYGAALFTSSIEAAPVKKTGPRDHSYRNNSEGRAKAAELRWCACAQCAVAVGLLFDTLRSHSFCLVLPFKSLIIKKVKHHTPILIGRNTSNCCHTLILLVYAGIVLPGCWINLFLPLPLCIFVCHPRRLLCSSDMLFLCGAGPFIGRPRYV